MKRELGALTDKEFDLLVIGSGIHGAAAARDAAQRGLSVALIDKGDFVSGNSSNSLKIVHGGLRYLQNADIVRMRESIGERKALLRIAPHLVKPLPCLLPTYGLTTKGLPALTIAMILNDIISFDRNHGQDKSSQRIPGCKTVSKEKTLKLLPGLDPKGVTGAALWHDAQMHSSERLVLAFVKAAVNDGAVVANYLEAMELKRQGKKIASVKVRDRLGSDEFEIRTKAVMNCSGANADKLLENSRLLMNTGNFKPSTAMNLIIKKRLTGDYAAGIRQPYEHDSRKFSRVLFFTPWQDVSVVGTRHLPMEKRDDAFDVTESRIQRFIDDINDAYPGDKITRDDVLFWHWGILPHEGVNAKNGEVMLSRHSQIIDHKEDDLENLISIIGVKFTTGRQVAQKGVDLVVEKLGKTANPPCSAKTPLPGADFENLNDIKQKVIEAVNGSSITSEIISNMARSYGSEINDVLAPAKEDHSLMSMVEGTEKALKIEVVHAARHEMACRLSDFLLRRSNIGNYGMPEQETLEDVANIMGKELSWNKKRIKEEIESTKKDFTPKG